MGSWLYITKPTEGIAGDLFGVLISSSMYAANCGSGDFS